MSHCIITCSICGLTQRFEPPSPGMVAECSRCDSLLARGRRNSLELTGALSLAALLFYVPANIYPIMRMEFRGVFTESTVWDGCVRLFQDGQWIVAVIVFLASLLIPLLKLLGLFYLVITMKFRFTSGRKLRARVHRIVEVIGPWAMLDVFLLAILVSLVKLGRIATVTPGPGLLAFTLLVVLTILATVSFDSKAIWDTEEPDS